MFLHAKVVPSESFCTTRSLHQQHFVPQSSAPKLFAAKRFFTIGICTTIQFCTRNLSHHKKMYTKKCLHRKFLPHQFFAPQTYDTTCLFTFCKAQFSHLKGFTFFCFTPQSSAPKTVFIHPNSFYTKNILHPMVPQQCEIAIYRTYIQASDMQTIYKRCPDHLPC